MCRFFLFFLFFSVSFAQNNFNAKGEREGLWKGYHENGVVKYEGEFINGKEIGLFKYYDYSGNMVITLHYLDVGMTSDAILYYNDGRIKSKGQYVYKTKHNEWVYYTKTGKKIVTENYVHGVLDGVCIYYHENGLPSEKYMYVDDVKNGLVEIFYPSGVRNMKSNYKNDTLHGVIEFYYNHKLIKLESKGKYNMGVKDSVWVFLSEFGDTLRLVEYKDGNIVIKK